MSRLRGSWKMFYKKLLPLAMVIACGSAFGFQSNMPASTSGNITTFGSGTVGGGSLGGGTVKVVNGQLTANSPVTFSPSGKPSINASIASTMNSPSLKLALGKKLLGVIPLVGTALAIVEAASAVNVLATQNSGGSFNYVNIFQTISNTQDYNVANLAWQPTSIQACNAWGAYQAFNNGPNGTNASYTIVESQPRCAVKLSNVKSGVDTGVYPQNYITRTKTLPIPTGDPVTADQLADRIASNSGWPTTSKVTDLVADVLRTDAVAATPTAVTGPATTPGTTSVSTAPDGKVTTVTTTNNYTYGPNTVTVTSTTISNTFNPSTNTTTTNGTTTVTAEAPIEQKQAITCGLPDTPPCKIVPVCGVDGYPACKVEMAPIETCGMPGKPACKIDETGTAPYSPSVLAQSKTDIDNAKADAAQAIESAKTIAAPAWSFSFQFPTGCAPHVTGIRGFILNVCPFQPQIHGLLSAIWAAATIFAMIGMVGKTLRSE